MVLAVWVVMMLRSWSDIGVGGWPAAQARVEGRGTETAAVQVLEDGTPIPPPRP
jgi:hypothetical protein